MVLSVMSGETQREFAVLVRMRDEYLRVEFGEPFGRHFFGEKVARLIAELTQALIDQPLIVPVVREAGFLEMLEEAVVDRKFETTKHAKPSGNAGVTLLIAEPLLSQQTARSRAQGPVRKAG